MSYFPMFVELKEKKCLIVGGGRIALRKAEALSDFGAEILVEAPEILPEIADVWGVRCRRKAFEDGDVLQQDLVVAATDDAQLNHRVSVACQKADIPVNAVDQTKDCTFIFPAYLKEGEVVAAFSSGGTSPVTAQYLKEQTRPVLTPLVGELAACLGSLRDRMRQCTKTESERKQIYRELFHLGLEQGGISEEEIARIICKYSSLF